MTSSKKKTKRVKKTKKPAALRDTRRNVRVSTNPVVRFATRLAVAIRGLKEVQALTDPKNVPPSESFARKQFKEVANVIKRVLKESE